MNEYPESCDTTPFWERLPEVAISFGSSSSSELVYLGVPTITLLSDHQGKEQFPKTGTFIADDPGIQRALEQLSRLLSDKQFYLDFLNQQRSEMLGEDFSLNETTERIIDTIITVAGK
jgi:UDP-N-acetylglucosamine 2-epimerase